MPPDKDGEWQRLPASALLVLTINGLVQFVRQNLFLVAGAGAGVAFLDWFGIRELILLALAVLLLITLGALLYHHRFRFRLEPDSVCVRRGVVQKKEIRIRFARIQNIEISQPIYMRPFSLVRFSLETPGAAEKEVQLPGISHLLAEQMRDRIIERRDTVPGSAPVAAPEAVAGTAVMPDRTIHRASAGRLFLHGLSSNQVWVILAATYYVYSVLEERLDASTFWTWLQTGPFNNIWSTAVSALLLLLALLLFSGLGSLIRFHGYQLLARGDRLIAIAGLLDKREQTLKREKITGIARKQSAIGRLLGCWTLTARQTGSGSTEKQARQVSFMVPGLRLDDLSLSEALLAGSAAPPDMEGIDGRFRSVYLRRGLALIGLVITALLWRGREPELIIGLLLLMPAYALMIHLRWRQWRWGLESGMLWVTRGLLGQRIDVFPIELLQQATVSQSPYQRRHSLGTLTLALPQGTITVPYLGIETLDQLANQAVYAAESARVHRV